MSRHVEVQAIMALSQDEQRKLEVIEEALVKDDPRFARTFAPTSSPRTSLRVLLRWHDLDAGRCGGVATIPHGRGAGRGRGLCCHGRIGGPLVPPPLVLSDRCVGRDRGPNVSGESATASSPRIAHITRYPGTIIGA